MRIDHTAADRPVAAAGRATIGGAATVLFLGLTAGVQMSDRGVHAIISPAVRATFQVGDAVMGALHGLAGILVASALAVPLAKLADRHSRKAILLGLIFFWGMLTALGALAPNFALFFVGRAASGVTEFAMIPIVYSLIPDLVPDRWRVPANLIFAALMATGASAGFYLAGNLLDLAARVGAARGLDPWRAALLLLSLSAIPLLVAGLATVDPPRARMAAVAARDESLLAFVVSQLRRILLFLGAAGGLAVAVQALTPMIAMALVRRFGSDTGAVGHALGLVTLASSLASLPAAGLFDRVLRDRLGEGARPTVMAVAAALAIPCAAGLAFAASAGQAIGLVAAFLLTTCVANALIPTMLQDLAPPALCARCFAAYSFLIAAFCAVGPLLSGLISQFVAHDDLLTAIAAASVGALLLAVVSAGLSRRMALADKTFNPDACDT
ncbi:MFS transporter [Sphingomonas naphthae]|uniref:MFS transporter n=1 Tax=Sphingomonas naphthae TaxID=1813468 RepID=A0ABY7TJK1_9SPHN|nr:MFS transporter [Sphingomonas naphthae]WCT73131.1 MFS transporter [Sphingomonas naphthae]